MKTSEQGLNSGKSHGLPGVFISFEGIDGAGKSTHMDALLQAFCAAGQHVLATREPGGTVLAEALRACMLGQEMDGLSEALLAFAARRDHLLKVIVPTLEQGKIVLCDRFTDASFAYQGGGRGLDVRILLQLEQWVQNLEAGPDNKGETVFVQPDLTLWFDLPPQVAAQRLSQARLPDRFESQPLEFFEAVQAAYAQRQKSQAGRMVRIDADRQREQVEQSVFEAIRQRGWL